MNDLGQLFIIGLKGKTLQKDEKDFIVKNNIGGVILFDRNLGSPQEIHNLCGEIQSLRHKNNYPLFISIDMEGGRVARLKAPFTQWPPARNLGIKNSTTLAFRMANFMGTELRAMGINLDFAPCVDVFSNPKNAVIGDRAISSDPELVAKIASALVRGYIKSGIIPCAKHFPGHGNTLLDSHFDLPIEESDLNLLQRTELIPFKKVFRARLDMVMTAHIKFPQIDPQWPVTLSKVFVQKLLREEFRYKQIIITDDLDMKALASHYDKDLIPVQALAAGCDILLYCNDTERPPKALEAVQKAIQNGVLFQDQIKASLSRVITLKKEMLQNPDPLPWDEASKLIGHPEHLKTAMECQ
ncbi:MAG: beta-N-acetylhexosaminidase [Bdellovibrionales bacterium]|nr:beta-N-acetylhexosaminidase [Bdellovibrionales bacterium]